MTNRFPCRNDTNNGALRGWYCSRYDYGNIISTGYVYEFCVISKNIGPYFWWNNLFCYENIYSLAFARQCWTCSSGNIDPGCGDPFDGHKIGQNHLEECDMNDPVCVKEKTTGKLVRLLWCSDIFHSVYVFSLLYQLMKDSHVNRHCADRETAKKRCEKMADKNNFCGSCDIGDGCNSNDQYRPKILLVASLVTAVVIVFQRLWIGSLMLNFSCHLLVLKLNEIKIDSHFGPFWHISGWKTQKIILENVSNVNALTSEFQMRSNVRFEPSHSLESIFKSIFVKAAWKKCLER